MPEYYDFVNAVELSPLILAECKARVIRDLNEGRTSTALAYGLGAMYAAARGRAAEPAAAEEQLRRLAVPLAGHPSNVEWWKPQKVSRG